MRTNKHSPTAELHRAVIAELAPKGIRRASAVTQQQTEPVPAWTEPPRRTRRSRTPLLLLIGFVVGLILIILGIQVINWVNGVVAHWHGGDGYVSTLDTDVGHGGTSHFLAFYQNNTIVVVECSSDYSSAHTYTMKVSSPGSDHHAVTLDSQVIDGRRDLWILVDGNQASLLYNTGNSMSFTPPVQ